MRYGPQRIARRLHQISQETGSDRLVLCCWESRPQPVCHRGLVAAWMLVTTGERIDEVP